MRRTSSIALYMASFVRFLSSVQERNLIALSMLTNRATLLINIMSIHKSKVELCYNSSLGISIQSSTTALGVFRFLFPLSVDALGPYIFSAIITSSSVIGQFLKKFPQIANLNNFGSGAPIIW